MKTTSKTRHVYLYGEAKTFEQLGIDDVANTYLSPQADVAKRVRRTRNIGSVLGERVGNHKVGAQRNDNGETHG